MKNNPYNPETEPASWKWFNEKPNPEIKKDDGYCKLCTGCGEDGCCSWVNCFASLIENDKCSSGSTYLNDAMFDEKLSSIGFNAINDIKEGTKTAKEAIEFYDTEWSRAYDEIFRNN